MNVSRTIARTAAAAAAFTALALPAQALAAQPASLVASFEHKGYAWTMIVTDGGKDSLMLVANKKVGNATQNHTYSFSTGVDFRPAANLASAKLTANLGQFGRVNAAFRGGAVQSSAPPKGCTGPRSEAAKGTLAGKPGLGFVIDTTFFKTVAKPSVKASIFRQKGAGQLNCGTPSTGGSGSQPAGQLALVAATQDQMTISVTKSKAGAVTQTVSLFEQAAGTTVFHSISTTAAAATFTAADDLSTAHVSGVGPFLSGVLDFTATAATAKVSPGTLAGSFTAKFDSVGPKTPATGGELFGTLTRS